MKLVAFDSELWEVYRGAYGNVCEEVRIVIGDIENIPPQSKLLRLDLEEKNDYEIAYDNLWANLWHQMSFYDATYIVIPYMLEFLEKNEDNFDRQLSVISNMGICLATDIPNNKYNEPDRDINDSYEECVSIIQQKTKDFIKKYFNEIKALDSELKSMFVTSVMAILGDREAAFTLFLNGWEECYITCDKCGYDVEADFTEREFLESSTPAPIVQWDRVNYEDTYAWYSNFLRDLATEKEAEIVPYLYGTFICPECGDKKIVLDFMKY